MGEDELTRKRDLLKALQRSLHERELQAALLGVSADPIIKIEIEDIKRKIESLNKDIDNFQDQNVEYILYNITQELQM